MMRLGGELARAGEGDHKKAEELYEKGADHVDYLLYGRPLSEKGARELISLLHNATTNTVYNRTGSFHERVNEISDLLPPAHKRFGRSDWQPCVVFAPYKFVSGVAGLLREDGVREKTVRKVGQVIYRALLNKSEQFDDDLEYLQMTDEEHEERRLGQEYEIAELHYQECDVIQRWEAKEKGESEYWSELSGKVMPVD